MTNDAKKIGIIDPERSVDNSEQWVQEVLNHFKVAWEFEYNMKPPKPSSPEECIVPKKFCRSECVNVVNGSFCKLTEKKESKDKKEECICRFDCSGYPDGCDDCDDNVANQNKYQYCSGKESCDNFVPNCDNCNLSCDVLREIATKEMKPRMCNNAFKGGYINEVKSDGSLVDGGIEVTTTGRRFDFDKLLKQNGEILKTLKGYGAIADSRCGTHMHVLLAYQNRRGNGNVSPEFENPMPQVIGANFHQLVRRFAAELIWITSALNEGDAITRYNQFRRGLLPKEDSGIVLLGSPKNKNMHEVSDRLNSVFSRYGMLNYSHASYDDEGDFERAHFEMRFPDAHFVSSAYVAYAGLFFGMWLKAAKLSQYGLISSGSPKWMKEEMRLFECINNFGEANHDEDRDDEERPGDPEGNRRSNDRLSAPPSPTDMKRLATRSNEMIDFFKAELRQIDDTDERICHILYELASNPISLRLRKGQTHEQIDSSLVIPKEKTRYEPLTSVEEKVVRIITLSEISEPNKARWFEVLGQQIDADEDEAMEVIEHLSEKFHLEFDASVGSFISMGRKNK